MCEIWIEIVGYPNYQVSNLGRVRSCKYKTPKVLKLQIGIQTGYPTVSLYYLKKAKNATVHRLVALAFILNDENKPQVNHINGIKSDNRVENLEWCTNQENTIKAFEIGTNTIGENRTQAKLNNINVLDIRNSNLSNAKLALKYNVTHSVIGGIKRGERWKHV